MLECKESVTVKLIGQVNVTCTYSGQFVNFLSAILSTILAFLGLCTQGTLEIPDGHPENITLPAPLFSATSSSTAARRWKMGRCIAAG